MTVTHSKLAFIFPGQGSQSKGMLAELSEEFNVVLDTFEEASTALGYDLWKLIQEDTESQLNQTEFTQPAMLASGIAAWRVWCASTEVRPGFVAGHSLGEYSALVAAEALDFGDALKLVQSRGRLMQAAVPQGVGGMAAILGLADEEVVKVCQHATDSDHSVEAANFNGPGQVVVSGHAVAVERAMDLAKAAGAKRAVQLPVSGPFHSTLMRVAGDRFKTILEATSVKAPLIPVIHNVDVAQHKTAEEIRSALTKQISGSVRWTETIRAMVDQGVGQFIECGPGKVLQGMNKRIDANVISESIFDSASLSKALELVI